LFGRIGIERIVSRWFAKYCLEGLDGIFSKKLWPKIVVWSSIVYLFNLKICFRDKFMTDIVKKKRFCF